MKHQYFGDINDDRKYGLLRTLQSRGDSKPLVAWMLTHEDGGRDGNRRAYFDDPKTWAKSAPDLFAGLTHLLPSATMPCPQYTGDGTDRSNPWDWLTTDLGDDEMSLLAQLSSQRDDRSEYSNRQVVMQCLDDPDLLAEIAGGLKDKNVALVGDCAEVLTQVAEQHPAWVAPYADALVALLNHKTTRVRWEVMHALALVATSTPMTLAPLLPKLAEMIRTDSSVIVRDYATDAIANYAATGRAAAEHAYPLLKEALTLWNGKHAGHALAGLVHVALMVPALRDELRAIAQEYSLGERRLCARWQKSCSRLASRPKRQGSTRSARG